MQNKKSNSNQLYWSHTMTVTNCKVLITQCDTLSRHIWHWNLKKTISSKLSKPNFFKFILIASNCKQWKKTLCLPSVQQSIILDARIIRLRWKSRDYLSFSLSSIEHTHSFVYTSVNKYLFCKKFMYFFSRALEKALVKLAEHLTSSIRLQLRKVCLFYSRHLLYTIEVTGSQRLKARN